MKTMLKHWMNAVEGSLVRIGLAMAVLGCGGLLHAETVEQVLARYKLSPVAYFDASVAESVECNADGGVTAWRDLSSRGNDLTDYKTNKGKRVRYADGRYPNAWVYDMGAAGSGIDLKLAVNLSIRSFVMVVDIANNNNNKSFFLGSGSYYYFHRGDNGQYAGKDGNNAWKTASGWENGVKIEDMQTSSPATGDLSLYTFNLNGSISWSRLSDDRNISGRNGGRKLALLICFDSVLSDEARLALEAAIKEKLTNTKPAVKVARQGFQPNGAYALSFALDWSGVGAGTADIYLSVGESVDALGDEVHVGDDVALDASVAYEVAGLNKEHTYYYRVRTVNDLGEESKVLGRLTDPIEVTLAELGLKPQTHFDAANEFSFETNDEGKVIRWNGVENPAMDFGRWYATKNGTNFGSRKLYKDNWPVYDMGGVGSGIDLRRSTLLTSKAVVMAVDLVSSPYAFFLASVGVGEVCEFHRGEQGQYAASYACAGWKEASGCENGNAIENMQTSFPKTDEISVYTFNMTAGGRWNSLSDDRNIASRNGGRQLGELMTFAENLTEDQRLALQTALIKKWRPQEQKAVTATWTGEAGDGDFANAGNWCCSNDLGEVKGVLPNALTAVTIPGELVMDIPVGAPLECKSIAVAGPFANDCDWSGLGSTIAGAGTIDLKGHKLTLTDLVGNYGITDSSEEGSTPGELHIKVENGKTIQNTTVAFTGSLKIVKEGEGILELGAILQTNVGGWEIAEGTVKAIANPYSKTSTFFGEPGSTVVVREGAIYDLNKQYDTRYYPFILDGGTIANRGGDESAASGSMGPITLTKNSNFDVTYSFPLWGKVDLGGLTLTVNIADDKSLYLHKDDSRVGGTFENGTVIVTGGGYFAPNAASGTSRDMRTVDFRFEGPLAQTTSIDVRNLTMIYDDTKKLGSGKVNIYGIFTPSANNYLNNFVMQDGSTLNLVGREGIYDTSSTLTSQTLGFGDNATILIDVGERKLETNEKVVAWSAKPANVGGLTFKFIGKNLDYESVNAVVMDDGIYYPDVTTIEKATWTGAAGDGNLANTENWTCENALELPVPGALPGESTVVYLNGEIAFNVPSGATFTAGSVNANASLKGDTDWSGLNPSIPVSGTIDLNGHKLTVANLVGNYEVTDSSATVYERLEYIQSTGAQWIDTGVLGNMGLEAELDMLFPTVPSGGTTMPLAALGLGADGNDRFYVLYTYQSKIGYRLYNQGPTMPFTLTANTRYLFKSVVHTDELSFEVDGVNKQHATSGITPVNTGLNLYMFACNEKGKANYFASVRVFSAKISEGGTPLRDFVPVKRVSDGAIGLLDLANLGTENEFYENKGTTAFTAGATTGRILTRPGCDEEATPGEFHINVASGSIKNTAVTFTGMTKVVKDGEGTLELGTIKQSNADGWEIAEGTVKASGNLNTYTSFGQVGATVVVREGATYDINGQYDSRYYPFVLDGGTIANTGSGVNAGYGCMGPITLTKDSYLNVASSFPLWGKVDLGGFTLSVDINTSRRLYLYDDGIFENGTVDIIAGGLLDANAPAGTLRDMRTVDFKLNADLALTSSINVRDLTSIYDGNWKEGTAGVNIYGVFTPSAKNYIHNFVMQDGSTLNLAGRAGIYDVTSSVVTGNSNVLGFADGATINLVPGDKRTGKVVSWTEATKPADTVKFVADRKYGRLEVKDDGLYLHYGLLITIQ